MNKEVKTKWIEALRSGKYTQGKHVLHNETEKTYCCLGVLCEISDLKRVAVNKVIFADGGEPMTKLVTEYWASDIPSDDPVVRRYYDYQTIPEFLAKALEMETSPEVLDIHGDKKELTVLNDDHGYTFNEIADLIEAHL